MSQEQEVDVVQGLEDANQFSTTGPIVIGYSRSSLSGKPQLSYKDAELDIQFSGEEITQTESPVGELVTVTLKFAVDAFLRSFTLVVPKIRLALGDDVGFTTFGFETMDVSEAFVRPPGKGVKQTYKLHELTGVAQVVRF